MFRLLFRYLMPLAFLVVFGLVGYNYFFGNEEEQAQSRAIIGQVTNLGRDVFGLLQSEKEKFDAGKYDSAMDRIKSGIQSIRSQIGSGTENAAELQSELSRLEGEELQLEAFIDRMRQSNDSILPESSQRTPEQSAQEVSQLNQAIRSLVRRVEEVGGRVGN